jgi:hypothetical protein
VSGQRKRGKKGMAALLQEAALMRIKPETMKIKELLGYKRNGVLKINPEYQRGAVWQPDQQKKLIDSVLRGYPLPLIYLHDKTVVENGKDGKRIFPAFEIIDGRQRIDALYDFSKDAFALFDPVKDDRKARFPEFIKKLPCAWAWKKYSALPPEDKDRFDNTEIFIIKITTNERNEARDLFIRLQAGLPLNAQEKRDAWPGDYTQFVLEYGGKPDPDTGQYPGHNFFQNTLRMDADRRGKARLICAQASMLFFEHTANKTYVDVGTRAIDDYYYKHLDFDTKSDAVKSFKKTLDKLADLFSGYHGKKIGQHEAAHLVLFVHTLMNEYRHGWEPRFMEAFEQFRKEVLAGKKQKSGEYWQNFSMLITAHATNITSVKTRHEFFSKKMLSFLNPVKKDANRSYNEMKMNEDDKPKTETGTEKFINIKGVEFSLHKDENEKTQDFVKRTLHLMFNNNLLPEAEIRKMLDNDYSKETFGLSLPILQNDKTKLKDEHGHNRYWLREIFGNRYYVCSQWWKDHESMYSSKLSEWIKKIAKLNKTQQEGS